MQWFPSFSDSTLRLSKTICGYTTQNLKYSEASLSPARSSTVRLSRNDLTHQQISGELRDRRGLSQQADAESYCIGMTSNNSMKGTRSGNIKDGSMSSYLSQVASTESPNFLSGKGCSTLPVQSKMKIYSSAEKSKFEKSKLEKPESEKFGPVYQAYPTESHGSVEKTVERVIKFFEQKADDKNKG